MNENLNTWSCIPRAFAEIFGIKFDKLLDMIGHDGSEIWWPGYPEPYCRRAFHIQEMIDAGFKLGWYVLVIESAPMLVVGNETPKPVPNVLSIQEYMKKFDGVLLCSSKLIRHAFIYRKNSDNLNPSWNIELFAPCVRAESNIISI